MKTGLTTREKWKVVRFAIGVLAVIMSYGCLVLLPLSTMFGLSFASGAAMTAGGTSHPSFSVFLLPLFIGSTASLVAVVFGPGLIIRLFSVPSILGYVGALLFLKKFA